uniref:(California timema) hypothetical protein n=1 Tax=Timema californicum TaxID=61474 RepID=A0A7R9J303_TIMCA|nr:unnamed protein product [Timema californicum]
MPGTDVIDNKPPEAETEELLTKWDLEQLLSAKLGPDTRVDSIATKQLTQPGENYGSNILSVEVTLFPDHKKLDLVAKLVPLSPFLREIFNCGVTVRTEIDVYTKVSKEFQEIQRENNISKKDYLDIFPHCYGARVSRKEDVGQLADEGAAILIENLTPLGYRCGDRITGVDLEHSEMVASRLAKFHATSIAIKIKKPSVFKEVIMKESKMKSPKENGSSNGVMVTRVRSLDEDEIITPEKKGSPLEPEFTKPEKDSSDDSAPPVAFFKLFRFSTASEKFILFIGLISGIACGLCTPANSLLYGDLTGSMVNFGTYAGIASMNESATIPPEVVQEFVDAIVRFAIGISCVGAVMLVCTYISITTFNYAAQKQRSEQARRGNRRESGHVRVLSCGIYQQHYSSLHQGMGAYTDMFSITTNNITICWNNYKSEYLQICIASALSRKELEVYGQAGSIAEEVLSSIRTVVAFGGESKEVDR